MIELIRNLLVKQNSELNFRPVINGNIGNYAIFDSIPDIKSDITVGFVDGGNATIMLTSGFIYSRIRLGTSIFGQKKVSENSSDFNLLAYYDNGWVAKTNSEVFHFSKESISENGRINLEKIPQLVRRIMELRIANQLAADFVIIDGTLDNTFPEEKPYLEALKTNILALNKTNSIRTELGNNYTALLAKHSEPFICHNVLENIHFVKLSFKEHVFRIDGKISDQLLHFLYINSQDPVFRGYPYGLIVADRAARISDVELKSLKIELLSKLGKENIILKELMASSNAHEILDMQNIY